MHERLRLGVRLDANWGPLKRTIQQAASFGFSAVELPADHRDALSANTSESGRRHLARLIRASGMRLVSIAAPSDLSRIDLIDQLDRVITGVSAAMQMARGLEAPFATVSVNARATESLPESSSLEQAFSVLAEGADRLSIMLAVRSKSLDAALVARLLDHADCPFLRASFDPADAIVSGANPITALGLLADHIAIAYVRDAVGPHGESAGYPCAIGQGALDVPRYVGEVTSCPLAAPILIDGPSASRPVAQVIGDIDHLRQTGLL